MLSPHIDPAEFYFSSSIAAALGAPGPARIPEGPLEDFANALPQGYGRSKLVAEHIISNAVHKYGARARTFRIGQIVGDKRSGLWNDVEAIPLIIRSALTLKALPALDRTESWLPADTLATTVCELVGLSHSNDANGGRADVLETNKDLVYNLENPFTFHWTRDLLPALSKAGLQFDTVSPATWLEKLRNYKGDPEANPAVKLLGHFEQMYGGANEAADSHLKITFELGRAMEDSESLRTAPKLVEDGYVERFVQAWMKKWTAEGDSGGHPNGVH